MSGSRVWALAAVCGLWVGCYRASAFDSCVISCTGAEACPGSQTCGADGMCHVGTTECSAVLGHDGGGSDAGGDGALGAPDASGCVGHLVHACFVGGEIDTLALNGTTDTDEDATCTAVLAQGQDQPSVCAFIGKRIITTGNVRFVGSRPVALFALDDIAIEDAISLDTRAGSAAPGAGANDVQCAVATSLSDPAHISTGATGGSLGGAGGVGGAGSNGVPAAAAAPISSLTYLRGGCPGGIQGPFPDLAAAGGGGILIAAGATITLDSVVSASGQGGVSNAIGDGGRGGASGGVIAFDAPAFGGTGAVFANGGGGGGGGGDTGGGTAGADGNDLAAARGGTGEASAGAGNGGSGSFGSATSGGVGETETVAIGGGGGGGAGLILFYLAGSAAIPSAYTCSPPATRAAP